MSSFNTPGWDLSSNSIAIEPANKTAAKKRKHAEGAAGGEDSAPAVNVEALLSKFRSLDSKNKKKSAQQHKGPDSGPNNKKAKLSGNKSDRPQGKPPAPPAESKGQLVGNKQSKKKKNNNNKKDAGKPQSQPEETSATAEPSTSSQSQAAPASEPVSQPEAVTESQSKKRQRKDKKNKQQQQHGSEGGAESQAMSTLQNTMKTKLGGARFRWINEQLYTTTGNEALELMENDPSVFDEYHTGFRSQAAQWPVHPLDLIISSLKTDFPPRSLIVDLGAGDARLAQELHSQHRVVSYDLVSKHQWVQVAQCSQLGGVPLPGDQAAVADVVVCSLSLMGTDWVNQIRECHRLLRSGALLKIAEVSSRFTDIPAFEKLVQDLGFKQTKKDDSNTHFILFDFKKLEKAQSDDTRGDLEELAKAGSALLKPCLYKKRG